MSEIGTLQTMSFKTAARPPPHRQSAAAASGPIPRSELHAQFLIPAAPRNVDSFNFFCFESSFPTDRETLISSHKVYLSAGGKEGQSVQHCNGALH